LCLALFLPAIVGLSLLAAFRLEYAAAIWLGMRVNLFLNQVNWLANWGKKVELLMKNKPRW
jgi:hypothetical protein